MEGLLSRMFFSKSKRKDKTTLTIENLSQGIVNKEYIITDVYKFNRKTLKAIPEKLKLNRKRIAQNDSNVKQLNIFNDEGLNNAD